MKAHSIALLFILAFQSSVVVGEDDAKRTMRYCKDTYSGQTETTAMLKCVQRGLRNIDYPDRKVLEFVSYSIMLSTKVDRGEMSKEEADYLIANAKNRHIEQAAREETQAQEQQQCIRMKRSGMKCTKSFGQVECKASITARDREEFLKNVPLERRCTDEMWGWPADD